MSKLQEAETTEIPDISVVIATYNRGHSLKKLLINLATQTLTPNKFEVLVVDDGSKIPTEQVLTSFSSPYKLKLLRQVNAGAAAARHNGIQNSFGSIIVIVDDDMEIEPDFLEQHQEFHIQGADVVLGHITQPLEFSDMPLFIKFHQHQLNLFANDLASMEEVRGVYLCTGNVSFCRDLYNRVGGFNLNLRQAEDRELGIRFEKAGAKFAFATKAVTINRSDHTSLDEWLETSRRYGVLDWRIARGNEELENADPWHFLHLVNPLSRPILLSVVTFPSLAPLLSRSAMAVSEALDKLSLERLALAGATLAYGIQYFRGVRDEAGSLSAATIGWIRYLRKRFKQPS
ncbi:MAG: glycosyltransferase [Proteobacteria bacterium]|nr:glycosyltransferase [Pseudomonadota bacterium]